MRKTVSALVQTLNKSVEEIAASGAENAAELLQKSMGEFEDTLLKALEPVLPTELEAPLAKGLGHIALFANALRDADRAVGAIVSGQPNWMLEARNGTQDEPVSEAVQAMLHRFIDVGWVGLRALANENAMLPEDEADLERAEQAGELAKVEAHDGGELLVKTVLPAEYRVYLTDPVELVASYATLSRSFADDALDVAEGLAKSGELPEALTQEFPELLAPSEPEEEPVEKLSPEQQAMMTALGVRLRKAANDQPAFGADDTGGDPNPAPDMGDDAMPDPLEAITRMASAIVAIAGSMLQAQGGAANDDFDTANDNDDEMPDDEAAAANAPQPQAPAANAPAPNAPASNTPPMPPKKKRPPFGKAEDFGDAPELEKILRGEAPVSASVAEALEERELLKAELARTHAESASTRDALRKLQETVERLSAVPAAPKGAVFAVNKAEDFRVPGDDRQAEANRLASLAQDDPERASKELLKMAHRAGGQPLVPPPG